MKDAPFPTSVVYPEDLKKPSPFSIDPVGDSQIVPTVEAQKFEE